MRGGGFLGRAAQGLSLLLYSPAQDGKHIKCFPLRAELATNLTPPSDPETLPEGSEKLFQKSCCATDRLLCILIPAAHASGNKRERLPGELAQFG